MSFVDHAVLGSLVARMLANRAFLRMGNFRR
jgi:hypothetical protein